MNNILVTYLNGLSDLFTRCDLYLMPERGIVAFAGDDWSRMIFADQIRSMHQVKVRRQVF